MDWTQKLLAAFLCMLLLSCGTSSVTVNNVTPQNNDPVGTVAIISSKDSIRDKGIKIGEILLKEDLNLEWPQLKAKLLETAKQNGANIIEVTTIGYNLKNYGFYLEGNLFYAADYSEKPNHNCEVGFIRDRFESVLGSAFTITIQVNDVALGELKKSQSLHYLAKNCNENLTAMVNNKTYNIRLAGKSQYFKIGKQTSGGSNGGGIEIGIGGLAVIPIEDEELGRLLYLENAVAP